MINTGDKTDSFIEAVAAAYPGFRPVDLFDIDTRFRQGALHQAEMKVRRKGGSGIYVSVQLGIHRYLTAHCVLCDCMELPFVFNNIKKSRHMTEEVEEAFRLAEKMSRAWINFAGQRNLMSLLYRNGIPTIPEQETTMVFDNQCRMEYLHDRS